MVVCHQEGMVLPLTKKVIAMARTMIANVTWCALAWVSTNNNGLCTALVEATTDPP